MKKKEKRVRLSRYIRPYFLYAVLSPLLMILEVAADLCLPVLMSYIVDFGINEKGNIGDAPLAANLMRFFAGEGYSHTDIILTFGLLMLGVTLLGGFFGTLCAYTAARAAQGFGHDLRRDAFSRVMHLSIEQTDSFTTGSLVTRMTNDVAMIVEFVEMLIRMFVRSPMFLVGGTVMLLSLNADFGLVLLCSVPVLLLTLVTVLARAVPLYGRVQRKLDGVNSVVQENISGARVVKAYTREEYECARFGVANDELCDVNLRVLRLMAIIQPVLTIVLNFSVIAVVYIGGSALASGIGDMTTGTVMAGVTFVTQVVSSLMMVGMMFNSVSRAAASAKRVREVLESEPVILGGSETEGVGEVAIAFDGVSFAYPDAAGEPILSDITLDIKRGEVLAIIGETGCGKTSLVNLIPRFYDPTEGEVRVNGVPLRDYDLDALRKKIAYVTQKSELFSGSIADNIRWGDENATDEDIRLAARVAQADAYISHFPDGYDTMVAEKGASLSGGQKQRLSIARALCRRPEILILDDATSALDLSTEAKLRAGLREHLSGTTVVMIAQRIASVREADRIAVLEGGRITHCAPHEELLRISETYREIYASQSGKEVRV